MIDKVTGENEIWKTCPLDDTVMLSSLGRIKRRGKIKHPGSDRDGYLRVNINGKIYRLHRLIAELFVENEDPQLYTVVDHINNKKNDNRASNLRWTTPQLNSKYAGEAGVLSRNQKANKNAVVILIDTNNVGYLFNTNNAAAEFIGVDSNRISPVANGKAKTVKGYRVYRVNEMVDKRKVVSGEQSL